MVFGEVSKNKVMVFVMIKFRLERVINEVELVGGGG